MSRFSSLEFGREEDNNSSEKSTFKDEAYYMAEATTAFANARFEDGLRAYAKVLEFNPGAVSAWSGQVRMLIELGEFPEAKLWADKALEKFPNDPELLASKAVALARLGDLDAALAFSDASIEERGGTPYIWLARGDVQLARHEPRADYCIDKALAMAASDWFVHWLAARVYAFYRKFSIALKHALKSVNLDSSRASAWLQAGLCQYELGLTDLAWNSLNQAKELDPFCPKVDEIVENLGQTGFWSKLKRRIFSS